MRTAATNDVWRALYKRTDFPIRGMRVTYADVTALGVGNVNFGSPLSLICGENGVGKTTLLRIVHRALIEGLPEWPDVQSQLPPAARTGVVNGLAVSVRTNDGALEEFADSAGFAAFRQGQDAPPEIVFVDTATLIPTLMQLLRADQNLSDLIDGVTPRILDAPALEEVQQLIGRDYDEVKIFEIPDYHDFELLPYFRVTANGQTYGSEHMGTGELALLYTYWRVESLPKSSVLLLEEPESFIAPRSQRVLVDWLAFQIGIKRLFVIVSSHSGQIAERFPPAAILLCSRTGGATVIQHAPPAHILVERLNILSHRRCLILVEDRAAEALASALIRELEPRIHIECDIVSAGSSGHIATALRALPLIRSKRVVAIGLYDGDQQGQLAADVQWPQLLLPGKNGPEALLREICSQVDPKDLAAALGVSRVTLETALGGAQGKDNHDWLEAICATLEVEPKAVFRSLIPFWIQGHQADAQSFSEEIAGAARRPF